MNLPLINHDDSLIDYASLRFCNTAQLPVTKLPGFQKHHQIPTSRTMAQRFMGQLVAEDLKKEFQHLHDFSRRQYGFKRKQLMVTLDAGNAVFENPAFTFSKSYDIEDGSTEFVSEEIILESIADLNSLAVPEFETGFPFKFSELQFSLRNELDIDRVIDLLEEREDEHAFQLHYDFEATSCELAGSEIPTRLTIFAEQISLHSIRPQKPRELLLDWLEYEKLLQSILT